MAAPGPLVAHGWQGRQGKQGRQGRQGRSKAGARRRQGNEHRQLAQTLYSSPLRLASSPGPLVAHGWQGRQGKQGRQGRQGRGKAGKAGKAGRSRTRLGNAQDTPSSDALQLDLYSRPARPSLPSAHAEQWHASRRRQSRHGYSKLQRPHPFRP